MKLRPTRLPLLLWKGPCGLNGGNNWHSANVSGSSGGSRASFHPAAACCNKTFGFTSERQANNTWDTLEEDYTFLLWCSVCSASEHDIYTTTPCVGKGVSIEVSLSLIYRWRNGVIKKHTVNFPVSTSRLALESKLSGCQNLAPHPEK